jgi:Tfp pilus assembly protein PilV
MTCVRAHSRISRLRARAADESGFMLIEALAAMVILAVVFLAVLGGIDAASRSSGREKARTVASALADQDQERLHAMPASQLPEYRLTQTVTVGGASYTVTSEADWVSDANGTTVSCSATGSADYIRVRSTVTSTVVGTTTRPVVIDSLVTPPVGQAGANTGTLAVQVLDRDAKGVVGMQVNIVGANTGRSFSTATNSLGCAVFGSVPGDTYDVQVAKSGWVDKDGVTNAHTSAVVNTAQATLTTISYDRAASITTGFDSRWFDYKGKAWRTTPSRAAAFSVANSGLSAGLVTAAAASPPAASLTIGSLFPFADGYGVMAGRCAEQNPSVFDTTWAAAHAVQTTAPGTAYDRASAPAAPVRVPWLPVRVVSGSTPVGGASVVARLLVTTTASCAATSESGRTYVATETQSMTTYPTGRTLSGTGALTAGVPDGMLGMATRTPTAAYEFDAGVPFGTYWVCADAGGRRGFARVDATKADGPTGTFTTLDLNGSGSQSGSCATTPWPAV